MSDSGHSALKLPPALEADDILREWLQSQFYYGIRFGSNAFADDNVLCLQETAEPTDEDWGKLRRLDFLERIWVCAPELAERTLCELASLPAVRSVQLTDCNLTSDLARLLVLFQNLEFLAFQPSGPINGDQPGAEVLPEAVRILSALENLQAIELERAHFHPGAVAEFQRLPHLRGLGLCRSSINDEELRSVAKNRGLVSLDLMGTAITGAGIQYFGELASLTEMRLDETHLDHRAMEAIGRLTSLVDLNLRESGLQEADLLQLGSLRNLQRLNLWRLPVTDCVAAVVGELTKLQELTLRETPISDAGVAKLTKLADLQVLSLDETAITNAALTAIAGNLKHLTHLSVDETAVTDAGLLRLASLEKLEYLSFSNTKARGACFDQLRRMPAIKHLSHSELPLLKRSRHFLRYGEVDYIVDRRRSRLSAFISILPEGIRQRWWLEICCKGEGVPSGVQPAHLSEVSLDFPFSDWRSFAGQQFNQIANIDDGEEPVGNLYTGMHDAVSKLRIRFGRRKGRYFRIRISGMSEGGRFLVDGVVQMESVTVRDFAMDRGDVARARQLATEIFQARELGEPEVWHSDVTFPILVTD